MPNDPDIRRAVTRDKAADTGKLLTESDNRKTIMGQQMTLRGWTPQKVATQCGLAASRVAAFAEGSGQPYGFEKEKLSKAFGLDADTLLSENTPESRAEVNIKRPLI